MPRWVTRGAVSLLACCLAPALDESGIWLDVPFVKQEKNGCGAASIAMIMQYWRQEPASASIPSVEEIQRTLYSSQARGIYASDLERYLKAHGFRTFSICGEWSDLRQHLEKGRPLIVALAAGKDELHYVVVAGLDWKRGIVVKNDPAERKLLQQRRQEFERQWKAAGNWMLLALPKESAVSFP